MAMVNGETSILVVDIFFLERFFESSSTKVSSESLDALDAPSGIEFQDLDPLAGTIQGTAREPWLTLPGFSML